jgi:hypothetical protein
MHWSQSIPKYKQRVAVGGRGKAWIWHQYSRKTMISSCHSGKERSLEGVLQVQMEAEDLKAMITNIRGRLRHSIEIVIHWGREWAGSSGIKRTIISTSTRSHTV